MNKNTINYRDMNFKKVDTKGPFSLLLNYPRYRRKRCTEGLVIYNKKTGEEVGQSLDLTVNLYDENFNLLKEPIFEEDCYAVRVKRRGEEDE